MVMCMCLSQVTFTKKKVISYNPLSYSIIPKEPRINCYWLIFRRVKNLAIEIWLKFWINHLFVETLNS